jgi:hypothetical protein
MLEEEEDFKASKVRIIDETEYSQDLILTDQDDLDFLEKYNNIIRSNRPHMTKEEPEAEKDYDYHINTERYNPWDEYKQIYSGIYKKGKIHWLLRKMPEWKFLQVGDPLTYEDTATNPRNRHRDNMDDSIFNALLTERYFDERLKKEGLFRGKSTTIRI